MLNKTNTEAHLGHIIQDVELGAKLQINYDF